MEKNSSKICYTFVNRILVYKRIGIGSCIIFAGIIYLFHMTHPDPTTTNFFATTDLTPNDQWKSNQFLSANSKNFGDKNNNDDTGSSRSEPHKICSIKSIDSKWAIPNFLWQMLQHRRLTYFLFGAYWDNRQEDETAVRILAMISNGQIRQTRLFCHLWYKEASMENGEPLPVVMLATLDIIWYNDFSGDDILKGPKFIPYLISCPVPTNFNRDLVPYAVSLAENYMQNCSKVANLLPIVYQPLTPSQTEKKDFAICHKALYYKEIDVSSLVIEWLEIHRILGVDKIIIYEYPKTSHPNISKVLRHYAVQNSSFVEVKPYTLPSKSGLSPKRTMRFIKGHEFDKWLNELIPYHDCFFRQMYRYKYIVLVDVDEVILPVNGGSWSHLLKYINSLAIALCTKYPGIKISAFSFENHIFLDRVHDGHQNYDAKINDAQFPPTHMMQNVWRVHQLGHGGRKCFFSTETGLLFHNHATLRSLHFRGEDYDGRFFDYPVDESVARLHHYMWQGAKDQKTMKGFLDGNETAVEDQGFWIYQNEFVPALKKSFDQIF